MTKLKAEKAPVKAWQNISSEETENPVIVICTKQTGFFHSKWQNIEAESQHLSRTMVPKVKT